MRRIRATPPSTSDEQWTAKSIFRHDDMGKADLHGHYVLYHANRFSRDPALQ